MNIYWRAKQVSIVASYIFFWFAGIGILESLARFFGFEFEGLVVTLTLLTVNLAVVVHYSKLREKDLEDRKDDALVKLLALTQLLMVGSTYYILMAAQF